MNTTKEPSDLDWLDSEEFNAAMYAYRTAPGWDIKMVSEFFEEVKRLCRLHFQPQGEPPRSVADGWRLVPEIMTDDMCVAVQFQRQARESIFGDKDESQVVSDTLVEIVRLCRLHFQPKPPEDMGNNDYELAVNFSLLIPSNCSSVDRAMRLVKMCREHFQPQGEPVAQVVSVSPGPPYYDVEWLNGNKPRAGTLLYASPPRSKGWRLVPVEPTDEMELEGMEKSLLGRASVDDPAYVNSIFKAMIAAAPPPPSDDRKEQG